MRMMLSALILSLSLLTSIATAGPTVRLDLNDGSTITGELLSFDGNTYHIRSDILGTLDIPVEQVVNMGKPGDVSASTPQAQPDNSPSLANITQLQQTITQDPALMGLIMQLQSSPEMQAILEDPATMSALTRGDLDALQTNPNVLKLMENPTVQKIIGKVQ